MIKPVIKLILPEAIKSALLFLLTYSIPIVCILLFEPNNSNSSAWINCVGVTTIAYCASLIFKHLFEHNRRVVVALVSLVVITLIIYVLLYAKSMISDIDSIYFWTATGIILFLSLVLDMCSVGYKNSINNPNRITMILSA